MELEHHKLPPRIMIANDGRILDTCKPLMSKPHEECPDTRSLAKAITGRMETFHAPCHFGDHDTFGQSALQRRISAAGMIEEFP
jgi:hypothetical protein